MRGEGLSVLTFADARRTVKDRWPDYDIAPYGFETDDRWILVVLPETVGGRIPVVSKATGAVDWISAYSPEYDESRPVTDGEAAAVTDPKPAVRRADADDLDDEAAELWRAGDENGFKKYWLGKGLKKWALSNRPWTSLFKHLVKHMPPEKARQVASRWFIEHFGYSSGSDKNRVAHGHPPRGDRVGPG